MNPLTSTEELFFYGITAAGTLQPIEVVRYMENTGPQWWLPVSGMTREEYWVTNQRVLVVRSTRIRTVDGGLRPSAKVIVEHRIRHGRRERANRPPEYGFLDVVQVRRESDGVVVSELAVDTVWLELHDGVPRVVTELPKGLDCPEEELPAVAPLPSLGEPETTSAFTWTLRETDITNGHVSFHNYFERAENALSDSGRALPDRPVWQGWYRQECFGAERMTLGMRPDGDGFLFGFMGDGEHRTRVLVRLSCGD